MGKGREKLKALQRDHLKGVTCSSLYIFIQQVIKNKII